MVARRALVIADALDLGLQHLGHVRQIDVVDARPRPVRRGRVVEGDRGRRLAERLHRPHLQRRLGQGREPLRRRRHHLGDEPTRVGQILLLALGRIRILEAWIGLQEGEEVLQRAGEADLGLDGLHLGLDAGDLGQTDLMDLVGGQVGGGRELEPGVVIGLALRQAPHARIAVRLGLHLGQRRQHGLEPGLVGSGQGGAGFRQQPVLGRLIRLQRRDLLGEVSPDRIVRPIVERCAGDDVTGVGDGRRKDEARRDDGRRRALTQFLGHLIHLRLGGLDPRDIGLGVGHAGDPVVVDQKDRQAGRRIAVGGELKAPVAPLVRQPRLLDAILEHPPRQRRLRPQLLRIELDLHLRQLRLLKRQGPVGGGVRHVVQLVVVGLDPQRRHLLRAQRDPRLEGLFKEGVQPGVLAFSRGCLCGGGGLRQRGRGGQHRHHGGGRDQKTTHEQPLVKQGRTFGVAYARRKGSMTPPLRRSDTSKANFSIRRRLMQPKFRVGVSTKLDHTNKGSHHAQDHHPVHRRRRSGRVGLQHHRRRRPRRFGRRFGRHARRERRQELRLSQKPMLKGPPDPGGPFSYPSHDGVTVRHHSGDGDGLSGQCGEGSRRRRRRRSE